MAPALPPPSEPFALPPSEPFVLPSPPSPPFLPPLPPYAPPHAREVYEWIRSDLIVSTSAALASSLLLLILYKFIPRVRRTPGWLMVRATLCEMVVSACFLALFVYETGPHFIFHNKALNNTPVLPLILLLLTGFETMAHAWRLLVFIEIVAVYRNPFAPDRFHGLYPVFVLLTGLAAVFAIGAATGLTTHGGPADHNVEQAGLTTLGLAFVFVPVVLFAVFGFFLQSAVKLLLASANSGRWKTRDGVPPSISFLARQRVMRHGTAYLVWHGGQLCATLAIVMLFLDVDDIQEGEPLSIMWHALAVLVCGRPALSLVGWLVINDIIYLVCGVCSLTQWTRPEPTDAHLPLSSARGSMGAPVLSSSHLDAPAAYAASNRPHTPRSVTAVQSAVDGGEELGFKEELRFELLYDVAIGIGELAQRELLEEHESAMAAANEAEPWRNSVDIGMLAHRASHPAGASANGWPLEQSSASFSQASATGGGRSGARGHRRLPSNGTPIVIPQLMPLLASGGSAAGSAAPQQSPLQVESNLVQRSSGDTCAVSGAPRHAGNGAAHSLISTQGISSPGVSLTSPLLSLRSPPPAATVHSGRSGGCSTSQHSSYATARTSGDDEVGQQQQLSPGLAPSFLTPPPRGVLASAICVPTASCSTAAQQIPRSRSETHLAAARAAALDAAGTPNSQAQHYEVECFRRLRAHFGVSAATFAHAFPDDVSKFDRKWKSRLKESLSEGKSGSFFYRVVNPTSNVDGSAGSGLKSRFIVKQISRREKNELMTFLPAYERHVAQRKGKCFVQYLSCHSMTLRWALAGKVYFVVMTNLMPVQPWLIFDLKGATANRRGLDVRYLHQERNASERSQRMRDRPPAGRAASGATSDALHGNDGATGAPPNAAVVGHHVADGHHDSPPPPPTSSYPTLRDWEWMDVAMAVDVSPDDKLKIAETIASDAAVLGAHGMLDYSLLVGIHRLPAHLSSSARDALISVLCNHGGYVSVERQKVYFFGIIDVLERYTLRWQVQRLVLNMAYACVLRAPAAAGISALPPADYAERFTTFALHEVLQWSAGSPGATARLLRRRAVGHGDECSYNELSYARWHHLWQRRRRGLVKMRIEDDRADHLRRIAELERALDPGPPPSSAGEAEYASEATHAAMLLEREYSVTVSDDEIVLTRSDSLTPAQAPVHHACVGVAPNV